MPQLIAPNIACIMQTALTWKTKGSQELTLTILRKREENTPNCLESTSKSTRSATIVYEE